MSGLRRGAVAVLLVFAVACGGDADGLAAERARQTAVYAAVIRDVASTLSVAPDGAPVDRVVFVEALAPAAPIPIEVQAGVVLALEDLVDVAFIDDQDEAVDRDAKDRPVREGAALIALGPVPEGDDRVDVDVERYLREGQAPRWRATVVRDADGWSVVARSPVD